MQSRIVTEEMTYTIDMNPEEFINSFTDENLVITRDFVRIQPIRRENSIFVNTKAIIRVEEV